MQNLQIKAKNKVLNLGGKRKNGSFLFYIRAIVNEGLQEVLFQGK